jgi:diacylglycerol kinase (ATP)
LILVNPMAGRGKGEQLIKRVEKVFSDVGINPHVVLLTSPDRAFETIKELDREDTAVVAAGGDGTANLVTQAIYESGGPWPLGLVPLGFGNCLASSLKIPMNIRGSAKIIARGKVETLDLPWAQNRPIVVFFSCGFDADVVKRASDSREWGSRMRDYVKATWSGFWEYSWPELEVEVDGEQIEGPIYQIMLSQMTKYARFFRLQPSTVPKAYLFRQRIPQVFSYVPKLGFGMKLNKAADVVLPVRDYLKITSASPNALYQVDGDDGGQLPITCTIKPKAFKILVP